MEYQLNKREIVKVFKIAKKKIKEGKTEFICHALGNRRSNGIAYNVHQEYAKNIIEQRMEYGKYGNTLNAWLYKKGYATDIIMGYQIREYRVRWLDALIEEFSN